MKKPSRINPEIDQVKVDVKDRKLLELLSHNSREPYSSLAKKVALSRESIAYRTNRYLQKGVIIKTFAKIDFEKLGFITFKVYFNVDEGRPDKIKELIDHLCQHPNTLSVFEYSDRWDLEWVVIAKDILNFSDIEMETVSKHKQVILEKDVLQVIRTYSSLFNPVKEIKKTNGTNITLDQKDISILSQLNESAQLSTYKISENIKLSADGVGLRIKKLVESGTIEKFTILTNLSILGYTWYTFVINCSKLEHKDISKLKEFIKHPNIITCEQVFGNYDLLLNIIVKDQKEFHQTIKDIKIHFKDILRSYDTWVGYREVFVNTFPEISKKL